MVRSWIADKMPDQLNLPFALWASRIVRELIVARPGKRLGLSAVQLYLRRWGLSSHFMLGEMPDLFPEIRS